MARACPAGPRVGPERGGRKGEGRGVRLGPISAANKERESFCFFFHFYFIPKAI